VKQATLIYTTQNQNVGYHEWFPVEMLIADNSAVAELPKGTKHFFVNLIDENDFLVCYPEIGDRIKGKKFSYVDKAIPVKP